jgi:hypothetical protein
VFGWLKRRLAFEHRKLAYQTFKAATDPEMPFLCSAKGGVDASSDFDRAERIAVSLIIVTSEGVVPKAELVSEAFAANKDMRRYFDHFGRKDRGSFDTLYRPLMDWKDYFEANSNEKHLIESSVEIREEIARETENWRMSPQENS